MPEWLLALIVAIVAAAPGLYAIYRQRHKDTASVAEAYESMATKQALQIADLRKCQQELEDKVDELDRYVNELEAGVNLLINQLEANRMVPVWKPRKRATAA